jgi:molecular chaperone DnaK
VPQIEVTFDIDANGIVNVSAKDMATQKEQKITITASSGLSKDEVDKMMKEAVAHADEDRKRKEEIETRNHADQAVYGAEKLIREASDKLSPADRAPIETSIEELKKAIERNDTAEMKRAMDTLTAAQHRAAEAWYKASSGGAGASASAGQPGGSTQPPSGGGASQGDVIDAEVVEEEKK